MQKSSRVEPDLLSQLHNRPRLALASAAISSLVGDPCLQSLEPLEVYVTWSEIAKGTLGLTRMCMQFRCAAKFDEFGKACSHTLCGAGEGAGRPDGKPGCLGSAAQAGTAGEGKRAQTRE